MLIRVRTVYDGGSSPLLLDSGISEGIVSVLSPDGKLVSLINTSGPEISGLTIK